MYQIIRTNLEGCMEIVPNIYCDNRGSVVKIFHLPSLRKIGILDDFQEDLIVTSKRNVIRGIHFQKEPYGQAKIVGCIKGKIMDVVVDLRQNSSTYGQYHCFYLDESRYNMVYIPIGFGHGYAVLEDESVMVYKLSGVHIPEADTGIRWDSMNIPWNIKNPIISERDRKLPVFLKGR